MVTTGFKQVDAGANGAYEELSQELVIPVEGYLFTYVSNENPTQVNVYFDDFTIEQDTVPAMLCMVGCNPHRPPRPRMFRG